MMYSLLPLPLVAAGFLGGYLVSQPDVVGPTRDLAARTHASAAMAVEEPVIVEPDAATTARDVQRASDGLFYVRAVVNGQPVRFLVDTGASYVVLSSRDARAVGAMPAAGAYRASMATAGGTRPMAWTRLGEVSIAGQKVRGVTAAVVSGGPGVSLLGQNLLSKLGAVRIEGDKLQFRGSDAIS